MVVDEPVSVVVEGAVVVGCVEGVVVVDVADVVLPGVSSPPQATSHKISIPGILGTGHLHALRRLS